MTQATHATITVPIPIDRNAPRYLIGTIDGTETALTDTEIRQLWDIIDRRRTA